MATLAPDSTEVAEIDAALKEWRQGDLALDELWFVHIGDPAEPLTEASAGASDEGLQALMSQADGLVVVTQTCDVVRTCAVRPYIEVAPLVQVREGDLLAIQRGRRPALATLPALLPSNLAVDLDRVMTVEKSIVAKWKRTPGYTLDADGRAFAQALSRKRARFAFPDDFIDRAKRLQGRLSDKHEKNTSEGRGLRALREIRVQATPSWDADQVALFFWFICAGEDSATTSDGECWADRCSEWLSLVPKTGRFTKVDGQVVTLDGLTGAEYVGSDPLDLDHLSLRASDS